MELRNLPLGNFFMSWLREDAGISSTEFAVFSAILVSLYLPLQDLALSILKCLRPSALHHARDDAIRHANRKIADDVE